MLSEIDNYAYLLQPMPIPLQVWMRVVCIPTSLNNIHTVLCQLADAISCQLVDIISCQHFIPYKAVIVCYELMCISVYVCMYVCMHIAYVCILHAMHLLILYNTF